MDQEVGDDNLPCRGCPVRARHPDESVLASSSPGQRPTNENMNERCEYFPEHTDVFWWSAEDPQAVALALAVQPTQAIRVLQGHPAAELEDAYQRQYRASNSPNSHKP